MKKGFRLLSMLLAVVMVMTLTPVRVEAKGAHLNKTKVTISVGDKAKLKVAGASGKIKWTTSKKSVATVTQKGVVKAKKEGTAIVKAKIGKKVLKCKVVVEDDDDWDDEEDVEDTEEVVSNSTPVDKVKTYLKEHGGRNTYGNPVINMEYGDARYAIIYNLDSDALEFMCFFMGDVSGTATIDTVHIYFSSDMTGTASIDEHLLAGDIGSFDATGTFNVASYAQSTDARFTITNKEDGMADVQDSKLQELGQSRTEVTIAGCRLLLYQETGYNLYDLGFTSYE